jgi:hypothetical protein
MLVSTLMKNFRAQKILREKEIQQKPRISAFNEETKTNQDTWTTDFKIKVVDIEWDIPLSWWNIEWIRIMEQYIFV